VDGQRGVRQRINENITHWFGFVGSAAPERKPPVFSNSPVKPRANLLKIRLSLIQPYRNRPNRGGANDDKIPPAVIVDVCGLETETGYSFGEVCRQTKSGAACREMDADLINVATLPNCGCLRYMISV